MRRTEHTHPCARCKAAVPCGGSFERNYDGVPEVICTVYHATPDSMGAWECEECFCTDWCDHCGERPKAERDYCATCAPEFAESAFGGPH